MQEARSLLHHQQGSNVLVSLDVAMVKRCGLNPQFRTATVVVLEREDVVSTHERAIDHRLRFRIPASKGLFQWMRGVSNLTRCLQQPSNPLDLLATLHLPYRPHQRLQRQPQFLEPIDNDLRRHPVQLRQYFLPRLGKAIQSTSVRLKQPHPTSRIDQETIHLLHIRRSLQVHHH